MNSSTQTKGILKREKRKPFPQIKFLHNTACQNGCPDTSEDTALRVKPAGKLAQLPTFYGRCALQVMRMSLRLRPELSGSFCDSINDPH